MWVKAKEVSARIAKQLDPPPKPTDEYNIATKKNNIIISQFEKKTSNSDDNSIDI